MGDDILFDKTVQESDFFKTLLKVGNWDCCWWFMFAKETDFLMNGSPLFEGEEEEEEEEEWILEARDEILFDGLVSWCSEDGLRILLLSILIEEVTSFEKKLELLNFLEIDLEIEFFLEGAGDSFDSFNSFDSFLIFWIFNCIIVN